MPKQTTRVCFLDLDETLIPTEWLKQEILHRRRQNPSRSIGAQELGIVIRHTMNNILGYDFEDLLCEFIDAISANYDCAFIVTNARAMCWVQTVVSYFPMFKEKLLETGIRIIKTMPDKNLEPTTDNVEEFCRYWSDAKYFEFMRIMDTIEQEGIRASRTPLTEDELLSEGMKTSYEYKNIKPRYSTAFDITCIGDNEFEHLAFVKTTVTRSSNSLNRILKCHDELGVSAFAYQLKLMKTLIECWWSDAYTADAMKAPPINHTSSSQLRLHNIGPIGYYLWAPDRPLDLISQTKDSRATTQLTV